MPRSLPIHYKIRDQVIPKYYLAKLARTYKEKKILTWSFFTGVFIGANASNYLELMGGYGLATAEYNPIFDGNLTSVISGRLAHSLGFKV
jgi:hypothetical protein